MGNNDFLKRRDARERQIFVAGLMMGMQINSDYYQMSLNDPDVMGKDTLGRGRIDKVVENIMKLDEYYSPAFSDDVEAERYQDEMDRKLRKIYKKDLVPFRERHPNLKTIKYDKPKKGWV